MDSYILEFNKQIKNKDFDYLTNIKNTLRSIEEIKDLNAYINLINDYKDASFKDQNSLLNYVAYAVKDNINVNNYITTGGSLFFENYISPFSATVINLLNEKGAIPVAKTNLDEFGLGGTGLLSAYKEVINPIDKTRIVGGSSSGSAVLVQQKKVAFALATDTGDSIRFPASVMGIVGYKPSYGLISRYGVFPFDPSLDHVGIFTNSIIDLAIVSDAIVKNDPNDTTSQNVSMQFYKHLFDELKNYKIATFFNVLKTIENKGLYEEITKGMEFINESFKLHDVEFSIDDLLMIPRTYEIIAYSSAVSCYNNISGISFGKKSKGKDFFEKAKNTRTQNFGKEIKRRFILGSYFTLSQNYKKVYLQALKIRSYLVSKINKVLDEYDFVLMPATGFVTPTVDQIKNKQFFLTHPVNNVLQLANFAGLGSITFPFIKYNNLPVGINLTSRLNNDEKLLNLALKIKTKLATYKQ